MTGRRSSSAASRATFLSDVGLDLPPLEAGRGGDPGLFGPGSEVWRIGRERALLLGGGAALLLQISHPLIAAGVSAHSTFPQGAFDRLRSTLDATLRITFGDREQAERAAAGVRATHARVRGTLIQPVGPFPAGMTYDAEDPALALWVHATLVVTGLDTYHRFVGRLGPEERAGYYEDAKAFGALFGVHDRFMPATYRSFIAYVRDMVTGPTLAAGPEASRLAREILRPPLPLPMAPAGPLNRLITAGLLPPRIREAFGLRWTARDASAFHALASGSRWTLPLVPSPLRYWPHYLAARRRMEAR
jgi:uncharacterized protein (DUF2236 family)